MDQPPKKRKRDTDRALTKLSCIVHVPGLRYSEIQSISASKDPEKKVQRLKEVKVLRLGQPPGSSYRMKESCDLIPDQLDDTHGFHWECYKRFTGNLDRLKPLPGTSQSECFESRVERLKRRSSGVRIVFDPDCIFCGSKDRKKIKIKGSWTSQGMSMFEFDGWKSVLEMAEKKNDEKLLTRIRGHDLFACEAKFHKNCRLSYMQRSEKWQSTDPQAQQEQKDLEEAHQKAFNVVCQLVERDILYGHKIMKLSDLREIYVSCLAQTKYANSDYRSEKLKHKLEHHEPFNEKLSFCDLGTFQSYILFSTEINVNTALKLAFQLGSADVVETVGTQVRNSILENSSKSPPLIWPPMPAHLTEVEDCIPKVLHELLSYIITGKKLPSSSRSQRLLMSIGQDICRAATNGSWKLPKHILLCMSLRHLFRSEKLITLLNRLGHCESYSFSLELETAIASSLMESSSHLSNQIIRSPSGPALFHSEFDNFDCLINDLTGKGSIHTAHGIMMQDLQEDQPEDKISKAVPQTRTGHRSLQLTENTELPDCYITKKKSPKVNIQSVEYPDAKVAQEISTKHQLVWMILRLLHESNQQVPSWSGFISETGTQPSKLTTIDYYPVINQPITEYKTVQECLRVAEEATSEVGQEYVITTFDLGVCMKAYPLIWNQPQRYNKHIILIGTFHMVCAYMKALGKKMAGSGLSEIFIEAGLVGSGSLSGVVSGKHYDRALYCHTTLLESLERLLLDEFVKTQGAENLTEVLPKEAIEKLSALGAHLTKEGLNSVAEDGSISKLADQIQEFRQDVTKGQLGKTAQLWISYMEHVRLVLQLIEAVKTNNFLLYAGSVYHMTPLFFSFDGQNYARYLSFFSIFLANIDISHPGAKDLIERGAISVARSFVPGSRCDVDKTMEETFMKHAKSHGGAGSSGIGASGLLTNYEAYQRWARTTHARSLFLDATLNLADMLDSAENPKHRTLRPSEVRKGEENVQKTRDAVCNFLNPFDVDTKDKLLILSSGSAASSEVEKDVLNAETLGQKARDVFIQSRLKGEVDFFDPVKRLNLKTLESMNKVKKIITTKKQVVQFKQQGNVAFQLLIKSQNLGVHVDLKMLMTHPLTLVPFSIATADGNLVKTDKAKGFNHITKDCSNPALPPTHETLTILDGNACFYFLKDLPGNFSQICAKVFDMLGYSGDVIFSTDQYFPDSIKSMERRRRGCGEKLVLKGEATKRPADWKAFLANEDNKVQFIRLILRSWQSDTYAPRLQGRRIIFICEGKAHLLMSADGIKTAKVELPALNSSQEETDSRVILYLNYAKEREYQYARVKSPDSDIFFIMLHYAASLSDMNVLFDTGSGNKQRLINITTLSTELGQDMCTALMSLHAFSGCDTTSAFRGVGKLKPIKTLLRQEQYVDVLKTLGDQWETSEVLIEGLENFTCKLYSRASRINKVDDLRLELINKICLKDNNFVPSRNVDMGNLPPCKRALVEHIRRVNHQVGIWKRAHIPTPNIPNASQGHGWTMEDGILLPLWYEGDFLPNELINIAKQTTVTEDVPEDLDDLDSDLFHDIEDDFGSFAADDSDCDSD